jgi:hypothetical protein
VTGDGGDSGTTHVAPSDVEVIVPPWPTAEQKVAEEQPTPNKLLVVCET